MTILFAVIISNGTGESVSTGMIIGVVVLLLDPPDEELGTIISDGSTYFDEILIYTKLLVTFSPSESVAMK